MTCKYPVTMKTAQIQTSWHICKYAQMTSVYSKAVPKALALTGLWGVTSLPESSLLAYAQRILHMHEESQFLCDNINESFMVLAIGGPDKMSI